MGVPSRQRGDESEVTAGQALWKAPWRDWMQEDLGVNLTRAKGREGGGGEGACPTVPGAGMQSGSRMEAATASDMGVGCL